MNNDLGRVIYRMVWRWHFYAGVFCIPFVITLSLSGAIYLFKPQFERWNDVSVNQLAVADYRYSPNELIATARSALPGSQFMAYRLPESDRHSVIVSVQHENERFQVYVDPYKNVVMKSVAVEDQFMQLVKRFHGELLIGNVGSVLVELAACWAIILVFTGVYLWWPRRGELIFGTLVPRLRASKRIFWRDLHAVTGLWLSAFTLFLLISGLPWALVWGAAFKEVKAWSQPSVTEHDWSHSRAQEKVSWRPSVVDFVDLPNVVVSKAHVLNLATPVEISVAGDDFKVSSISQNRPLRADEWLNKQGDVARSRNFSEKPLIDRVVGVGIAAHEGHLFGWFNLLLGVLTTLGLIVLCVSGVIMWWRRRPKRSLGAPEAIHAPKVAAYWWL